MMSAVLDNRNRRDASTSEDASLPDRGRRGVSSYVVKEGESISVLAARFKISTKSLMEANHLTDPDRIKIGDVLTIPAVGISKRITAKEVQIEKSQGRARPDLSRTYVVQSGDTVSEISERLGIDQKKLLAANPKLDPDSVRPGQLIKIPRETEVVGKSVPDKSQTNRIPSRSESTRKLATTNSIYTVSSGDTLSEIAEKFGKRVSDFVRANPGIDLDSIKVGQEIAIPGRANASSRQGASKSQHHVTKEFLNEVKRCSELLGVKPLWLMACMHFETMGTFDPSKKNQAGSSGTGLIQFMERTAKDLFDKGTEFLAGLSATRQLKYVHEYFSSRISQYGALRSVDDCYMAILYPEAIGKPSSFVLFSEGTKGYSQNRGLDSNGDGTITKAEACARVRQSLEIVERDYGKALR